jgi:cell division protein FtsB
MELERKVRRWIWAGLGGILLLYLGLLAFGEEGLIRYFEKRRELAQVRAELELVRQQNAALRARLEKLQAGDSLALEEEARRQHMIGPNEEIYDIEVK